MNVPRTVLLGDELRRRGITQVAEALRTVPGATVVETGSFRGQTSLFLRGGKSDYVKVLIDRVPVNDPRGSSKMGAALADLPPDVGPCGENGGFHTFVYAGPIFARPIPVRRGKVVVRGGRFVYCGLLEITE